MLHLFLLFLLACQLAQAVNAPGILPRGEEPSSCIDCRSRRTMFNIIWSCVSTTIICAWAAVHPNMPPREGPLKRGLRRLELMIWTILGPEILPSWALNQRLAASAIRDVYNKAKGYKEDGICQMLKRWVSLHEVTDSDAVNPAWTLKHGHFLMMGGIHLVEPVEPEEHSTRPSESGAVTGKDEAAADVERSGTDSDMEKGHTLEPKPLMGRVTILTLAILEEVLKDPEFDEISVTEDDIIDRSKADALAKIIFMLQSSWFILHCVARRVQGLDITQLELTTVALASLNSITFILWWDKPLCAQTPVRVYLRRKLTDYERSEGRRSGKYSQYSARPTLKISNYNSHLTKIHEIVFCCPRDNIFVGWLVKLPFHIFSILLWPITLILQYFGLSLQDLVLTTCFSIDATHVPTFYAPEHLYSEYWHICFFMILGPLFGCIHCMGWNFIFPSFTKQQLWRVGSLVVTTVPICCPALLLIWTKGKGVRRGVELKLFEPSQAVDSDGYFGLTSVAFYATARIVLLVLAIVLLTDQPPGAFIAVNWTNFFPHFL